MVIAKNRDLTIDAIKGMGIVLMVYLHAGGGFSEFVNLFHMAVFFIASGYLWNRNKAADFSGFRKYAAGKLKTLWLPFVLFNGILLLLNNVLVAAGIYETALNLRQTALSFAKVLVFSYRTQLGTPTWFLAVMFFVTLIWALLELLFTKTGHRSLMMWICFAVFAAAAQVVSITGIRLPANAHSCFIAFMCYEAGMFIREFQLMQKLTGWLRYAALAGSFAVLTGLSFFTHISFINGELTNAALFVAASLCGWVFLWATASVLFQPIKKAVAFLGQRSMWILLYHLLFFKAVTWIYLLVTKGDMLRLTEFPSIKDGALWIIYLIAGVLFPVLLSVLWKSFVRLFRRNKNGKH